MIPFRFMKNLERAPFSGKATRIGYKNSMDSVVMLMQNNSREDVVKWNKSFISSPEDAFSIVKFAKKSIELYRAVLGEEHVVPTEFVIGEKVDSKKSKIKVYEVQPYINGWDGRTLPKDLRTNNILLDKWNILYSRLSILYKVSSVVNRGSSIPFNVNLTLGACRKISVSSSLPDDSILETDVAKSIPNTPNLLVDRNNLDLLLCDFGAYTVWDERMEEAYQEIKRQSLIRTKSLSKRNMVMSKI